VFGIHGLELPYSQHFLDQQSMNMGNQSFFDRKKTLATTVHTMLFIFFLNE